MRILHVSRRYAPEVIGGYERNCQRFAEEWHQRGHAVAVLTREHDSGASMSGVQVFRTLKDISSESQPGPFRSRVYQVQVGLANRRCRQLTHDVLRLWKPDVVVFWGMNSWVVSPIVAVREAGIPCVFDLGDYWLAESLAMFNCRDAFKRLYRRCVILGADFDPSLVQDAIVHSEFMRGYYAAAGVDPNALHLIPRGVPPRPPGRPQRDGANGRVRIICVGRLVPDKGGLLLAQAFADLEAQAPNVQLDFYGESRIEYQRQVEEVCRQRGLLERKIFLHGHVPPQEMSDVYSQADIVAFPVLWDEPSSNVLLEAMQEGVPIVCTRTGSNAEFVVHESTGLVVERNDRQALMQALLRLAQDRTLRRMLGEAGRRRVEERHRMDQVFDQTESLLETIFHRRSGRPVG